MTYRELKAALAIIKDSKLDDDVLIHLTVSREFVPVNKLTITDYWEDVLDIYHPILTVSA